MTEPAWRQRGPWRWMIAPDQDATGLEEALGQLPFLLEKQSTPLAPPGRHRVDRVLLPYGDDSLDAVVKTYGPQAAWRDRAARLKGSKAERAFQTAIALTHASIATPTPLAVVERWEHHRLRECRLLTAYVPDLTDLRTVLDHLYAESPRCELLVEVLQCVADAVRALHDAGILHRDLGNQNVGLQPAPPDADVPWSVVFLDLNRARHVASPAPSQRGEDLARLDLPSDFRRVFHAMYFHGHAPPPDFAEAERKARAAFDRHTALRPWRHPIREVRLRRAAARTPPPPRGRNLWIWDERSGQAIPAYTSRDRRRLLPAANVLHAVHGFLRKGLAIRRHYRALLAESFRQPVEFDNAIGMTLEATPENWDRQLEWLQRLQGTRRIPLLLRLYHHQTPAQWHWTLDQALQLHARGHSVALALVQDRRALLDPRGWRQMTTLAFDRAHTFADFFEVGHALNRSKWGVWDFQELVRLLDPVRASLIEHPHAKIVGPPCIDFEPHALAALLDTLPDGFRFHTLSSHLYVDRRGAPENTQGSFDAVGKCALLRAMARAHGYADDRLLITEVNWPLAGTGPWSPVTSPYETLDPRENDPSVDEAHYAAYMARYLLLTMASGHVSRVYWWRLAARGFGLIDDTDPAAWRPRPAFHVLQHMLATLDGASFTRRPEEPPGSFALEFALSNGCPLTARWTKTSAPEWT